MASMPAPLAPALNPSDVCGGMAEMRGLRI